MKINLSAYEIRILKIWGESTMSGGHWGDGDVVFPDEDALLEQIKKLERNESSELSPRNIDIALIWSEENHGTPEEDDLIAKLKILQKEENS